VGPLVAFLLAFGAVSASQNLTLQVDVLAEGRPIAGATVLVAGTPYLTDVDGRVYASVRPGTLRVEAAHEGFLTVSKDVVVADSSPPLVVIALEPDTRHEETVTVTATRTNRRLEDQPMRVEVLGREEIEEKMLMTPGDIVMMLNELGGMRAQPTSPALGAASVRVQGMRGRYTRFLSDGLPLFGEQPGGLGLLQIPPMDLAQVEVIKGVASALYGAGALGGVVDLVSRRPGDAMEREVLLNQSTRGGTDGILWLSAPLDDRWGVTFLGGGHFQQHTDVNDDGWADLPDYSRGVLRPRLFWNDGTGSSLFATIGFTAETRTGGTMDGGTGAQPALERAEALETTRIDGGVVGQTLLAKQLVLTVRGAVSSQRHRHRFGDIVERDRHVNVFAEAAIRGAAGRHVWVAGLAAEHNGFTPYDVPRFAFDHSLVGAFAQDDVTMNRWWTVSGSARVDAHDEYGWFFSPRVSSLVRGGGWIWRLSMGGGFHAPTALTEETEAAGLTRLSMPVPLVAEKGRSFSTDLTRELGPLAATVTAFRSRVRHPVRVERTYDYFITNTEGPTTNTGVEVLATYRRAPFAVTGTYAFVEAHDRYAHATMDVPLTPQHSIGVVAMWERENVGRLGIEWYHTGEQRLEGDPYGPYSRAYSVLGVLAEKQFGRYRVFINGENLTDVRQTKWESILRSSPAPDGRVTTDVWAPLEGRNINGGVRIRF
jgi:iron complex outermembrane receptor protein